MKLTNKYFEITKSEETGNFYILFLEPAFDGNKENMELLISCLQSAYEYLYE